jgi:hypothetical protein
MIRQYTQPRFGPDGRLAYVGTMGTNRFVVVDGIIEKPSGTLISELMFRPDGKRLTYLVKRGRNWVPVVNGLEGKEYDRFVTSDQVRSRETEGPRFVAFAFDEAGAPHAIALRGDELLRLTFEILEE